MRRLRRAGMFAPLAAAAAMTAAVGAPLTAHADVSNGCSATALASDSGGVDITTSKVWHVRSTDVVVGEGRAPSLQKKVKVVVQVFGVPVPFAPIVDAEGDGNDHGSGGPFKVGDYSKYARVFAIKGGADTCDGSITLIVDDADALTSVVGAASLGLAVLGLLGVLGGMRMRRRIGGGVVGGLAGFFGGTGLAEFLQQSGFLDPTSLRDLAVPAAGLLAGILLSGALAPAPPAPAAPLGEQGVGAVPSA